MKNSKSYTLSELTSLLYPGSDEDEAYRVSRKVQNQVNAGLIRPIDSKHTGRGIHRKYTIFEVFKAKVLLELEPFQVPNTVLQLIADLFDDANPERYSSLVRVSEKRKKQKKQLSKCLSNAISGKKVISLYIHQDKSGKLTAKFGEGINIDPAWTSAIVLNLTEIIRAVK